MIIEQENLNRANELMTNLEFQTDVEIEIISYIKKTAILRNF